MGFMRREQEVDVIRHQTVRVHRAAEAAGEIAKEAEISEVVAFREEAVPSIVPSLHDMEAHLRDDNARRSWHNGQTAEEVRPLTDKQGLSLFSRK